MYGEQVLTNKARDWKYQGETWFGDELRQVTKVGVSLRQSKDIAVTDVFIKKESVAITGALILFI